MTPRMQRVTIARRPKNSVLLYAVVLLTVAGTAVISLTGLVNYNIRSVHRAEDRFQAFYVSEAGVQQVVDWFNRGYNHWLEPRLPENMDSDATNNIALYNWSDGLFTDSGFQGFFAPDVVSGQYVVAGNSIFAQKLAAAGKAELNILDDYFDYVPWIEDSEDDQRGFVASLVIRPPVTSGANKDPDGTIARVICTGEGITGARQTVEILLYENPVPDISIPAGIMSKTAAASNGQFNVHWGEVWAKGALILATPFSQKISTTQSDPWYFARAEDTNPAAGVRDGILYYGMMSKHCSGSEKQGYVNAAIPAGDPRYFQPYLNPVDNDFLYYTNLLQHQRDLRWPTYDYATMKMLAERNGYPIYRWTADGSKLTGPHPKTGLVVTDTFQNLFNLATSPNPFYPDDIDRDQLPPIYFIDTLDGQVPRADGANLATIQMSGQGPFFNGLFFIAANIRLNGSGNSPAMTQAERPDRTLATINNTRIAGLFYCYGDADFSGQGDVYGALFAERGFLGAGSWDLYYDWRLRDPLRNKIGSRVGSRLWNTY